jgi:hypothetical protein
MRKGTLSRGIELKRIIDNSSGLQYDEKLKQEMMIGPEERLKKLNQIEKAKKELLK